MTKRMCDDCPIRGTKYCYKVNPGAKKVYTRGEKRRLSEKLKDEEADDG